MTSSINWSTFFKINFLNINSHHVLMPDASNCVLAHSDNRKLETSQPGVADGYISLERTKLMIPCVVSGLFYARVEYSAS